MASKSNQLTQFAIRESVRVLNLKGDPRKAALRRMKVLRSVDARLAQNKKRSLSGEEALWIARFYISAAMALCYKWTPELKDVRRCSKLALRYYRMAVRDLPRTNNCQARVELLSSREMRGIETEKSRRELIEMTRYPDALAYDCAMTLLGSFVLTPVSKPAVAAVKEVIARYERELKSLREELALDRTPPR